MNLGLKDKLIVVGGGLGGIGWITCETLCKKGARVIIADIKHGQVDLSKPEEVKEFFKNLRKKYKRLYGYCSFVYGGGGEKGFLETTPEDIQKEINGTLLAAVYPIQEAVKWMIETGGGHIVIISSINSMLGLNEFAYDMAKGALNRIGPDIATSCGKYNIYAVTLCPGTIAGTPSWEGKEEMLKKIANVIPDEKLTTAKEVGEMTAFMLSPYAKVFNGSILTADRGWHLKPLFKK